MLYVVHIVKAFVILGHINNTDLTILMNHCYRINSYSVSQHTGDFLNKPFLNNSESFGAFGQITQSFSADITEHVKC